MDKEAEQVPLTWILGHGFTGKKVTLGEILSNNLKKLFEEENIDMGQDKHGDTPWALGFECFLEPINLDFGKDIEVGYSQ